MSNLLPVKEIKKIERLYQKRFVVISLVSITVLFVIASICLFSLYYYSKSEENSLLEKKSAYEKMEVGKLKRDLVLTINDMNSRLNSFKISSYKSPIVASFIDPILKAQMNSIKLTNFIYNLNPDAKTAEVKIFGVSSSRESILTFADNLRNTPGITDVNVPITNFIKESNMPFSIIVTMALK